MGFIFKILEMSNWLLANCKKQGSFPDCKFCSRPIFHTMLRTAMVFSFSFKVRTGTDCSYDRLDKSKSLELITSQNCSKDISNHCSHWSFSGVTTESELILAWRTLTPTLDSICPYHRRELGIGCVS